ncbi:insulinase family protein [Paenibacillus polysaccharolyticus]|uniref:EF-P 5-aminopentanol modification-associated protein YfmF n=1 Tax=Paenibacillus polysaccharolyticus TaxID=582692 RepID=UPI00203F7616|nr:pitrilysin family protein [Paenibacillus polysaccharolyticus]MCM3133515.1 insulinase family protein [Paenibacillus polysaccharolyticus]
MENKLICPDERDGLHLHLYNTEKFKTISVMLTIRAPLRKQCMTSRVLLSQILNGGSMNYPTRKKIQHKLDEMYGAELSWDTHKKGEEHCIFFKMEISADQFLNDGNSLLQSSLLLLHEIIYNPLLEDGAFRPQIVEREKQLLKQRIDSMFNEKILYAHVRLIEEMYQDEDYAIPPLGSKELIDSLHEVSVFQVYEDMLRNDRFDLFIVGAFDEKAVRLMVKDIFCEVYNIKPTNKITHDDSGVDAVKVIHDHLDVQQGTLLMGYRTFTTIQDEHYEAARVANAIFGRFPTSRLFSSIREKQGLAYYAQSQMESNKGLLVAMAGIEFDHYDRVIELIREQEYAMKNGHFTEVEVEQGKSLLINMLLEAHDSPAGIMDIFIQAVDSGSSIEIQDHIQRISNVTKEDIICAVNKWELDTIYFLNRKESTI